MPRVKSIKVHHNAKLDESSIDKLVDADLTGKSLASLKNDFCPASNYSNRKLIREVLVPDDYPDSEDSWRSDVIQFLRIATWKGAKRLAVSGMDEMPAYNLPVSTGILADKIQMMTGQPTSFSLQLHAKVSQGDLEQKYESLQASKSQVIDAETVKQDDKRT